MTRGNEPTGDRMEFYTRNDVWGRLTAKRCNRWPHGKDVRDHFGRILHKSCVAAIATNAPPSWPEGFTDIVFFYTCGNRECGIDCSIGRGKEQGVRFYATQIQYGATPPREGQG